MSLLLSEKLIAQADTPTTEAQGIGSYQLLEPGVLPSGNPTTPSFGSYFGDIIQTVLILGAALAVLMIVIGGIEKIISNTPAGKSKGTGRMTNALIGLFLIIISASLLAVINPNLLSLNFYTPGPFTPSVVPVDDTGPNLPASQSFEVGQQYTSDGSGYYPADNAMEGGFVDKRGAPLKTLQQFLRGEASYVSVAMDNRIGIPYGQKVRIPELEAKYGKAIEFRVVDTGGAFMGRGTSKIDICVENEAASFEPTINGNLTLIPY